MILLITLFLILIVVFVGAMQARKDGANVPAVGLAVFCMLLAMMMVFYLGPEVMKDGSPLMDNVELSPLNNDYHAIKLGYYRVRFIYPTSKHITVGVAKFEESEEHLYVYQFGRDKLGGHLPDSAQWLIVFMDEDKKMYKFE